MEEVAFERQPGELSRAKRLKHDTRTVHERLDASVMACDPFATRERYSLFVTMQHGFHRDIDALYDDPELIGLLPDLAGRRRLVAIERDLDDLGKAIPDYREPPAFVPGDEIDLPTALGALYVAEGANLGAAFLLKEAKIRLGLSETFGARHLAAASVGRLRNWQTFTAMLDAVPLSDEDEARTTAGAHDMFRRVSNLVQQVLAN